MMMSAPTSPIRNAAQLVERARAARGGFNYGSVGPGSHPVMIEIDAVQGGAHVSEKSVFIVPR